MSYEVWGDNDDSYPSDLIDAGWWDDDTVQRVQDAVRALMGERVYEDGQKDKGVSVQFIMRLNIVAAEVGVLGESEPIVKEAREYFAAGANAGTSTSQTQACPSLPRGWTEADLKQPGVVSGHNGGLP